MSVAGLTFYLTSSFGVRCSWLPGLLRYIWFQLITNWLLIFYVFLLRAEFPCMRYALHGKWCFVLFLKLFPLVQGKGNSRVWIPASLSLAPVLQLLLTHALRRKKWRRCLPLVVFWPKISIIEASCITAATTLGVQLELLLWGWYKAMCWVMLRLQGRKLTLSVTGNQTPVKLCRSASSRRLVLSLLYPWSH